MNEEKTLTRIDSEYEKALAERNKLQAELDHLTKKETQDKHKLDMLKNRYKHAAVAITALSNVAQFWRVLFLTPRATATSR